MKNLSRAAVAIAAGVPCSHAFTSSINSPVVQRIITSEPPALSAVPYFHFSDAVEDIEIETLRSQARALEEEAIALEKQALELEEEAKRAAALEVKLAVDRFLGKEEQLRIMKEAKLALEEASESKVALVDALVAALEAKADLDAMAELKAKEEETAKQQNEEQQARDGVDNQSLRRMSLRERLSQIEAKVEAQAVPTAKRTNTRAAPSLSSLVSTGAKPKQKSEKIQSPMPNKIKGTPPKMVTPPSSKGMVPNIPNKTRGISLPKVITSKMEKVGIINNVKLSEAGARESFLYKKSSGSYRTSKASATNPSLPKDPPPATLLEEVVDATTHEEEKKLYVPSSPARQEQKQERRSNDVSELPKKFSEVGSELPKKQMSLRELAMLP